uniref:Uncharacterized protein n=1 Tax=Leersia perrieri TaxID=77586 RepID=A0A0D9VHT2_9ORYZ
MAAAAAGEDEYEICNDDGFVYKRRRGVAPPDREDDSAAAPSSTPAPPSEAVLRRRRRQALLRLRAKYLDELAQWEALSADIHAPLPDPPAPATRPTPDPSADAAAASSSDSAVIDELLVQAELMEDTFKRLLLACKEINEFCAEHEAALVDAVAELPVWGDPRELMNSLCSSGERPATGTSDPRELMNSLCSSGERPATDIKLISELDDIISHFALDLQQSVIS